jgi:hypothetical protein
MVTVIETHADNLRGAIDRWSHDAKRSQLDGAGERGETGGLRRLRELNEAECYARCYYSTRDETVKIVHLEPRRPRFKTRVTGEQLRRHFEERLKAREPLAREESTA